MNTKLNNINRYKKVSRDKVKKEKELKRNSKNTLEIKKFDYKKSSKKIDNQNGIYTPSKLKYSKKNVLKNNYSKENIKTKKKKNRDKKVLSKFFLVIILVMIVISISIVSKIIVKKENTPNGITVFSNKDGNVNLVKGYNLSIGISKLDTTDINITNNVILNELLNFTTKRLVSINTDYSIKYEEAEKIEQVNDTKLLVTLKKDSVINCEDIRKSVDKIKNAGEKNIYYNNVSNIESIESNTKESLYINLYANDPYMLYRLNFPINVGSTYADYNISDRQNNSITFSKNKSNSNLKTIKLSNFEDADNMVNDFRNDKLDMFVASSDSIMQLIGKHEYNVKKYRDGETIFLFGNKESNLFKLNEVRKALAYSINRDEIVRKVNRGFSEVIDLPYIYSSIKYKYDLYGAQNILLSNGWKNTGGIYNKNIDYQYKKLEMSLLVNKDDNTKVKIAEYIKEMVEQVGIKINIEALSKDEILKKIEEKNYDLVLSTVYVNDNPDISYLEKYININDKTNEAFDKVKASNSSNIVENVNNLQTVLSEEVSCIGIMAKNVNVVYQKYISGFENLGYMRVFDNLENIGKVNESETNKE